jgi:hypothetical protein
MKEQSKALKKVLAVEANVKDINTEALELNYYGKRLRDTRLTVTESIVRNLGLKNVECGELADWLTENKPVSVTKPKAKAVSTKLPIGTCQGSAQKARLETPVLEGQLFVVTCAQNNTEVNPVFNQLNDLAHSLGGSLVVMPVHYNKSAFNQAVESKTENFANEVKPYLLESNVWLGGQNGVLLQVEAAVLPTAKQPVNAAMQLNAGEACTVVASPKQDLQQIAVMLGQGDNMRQAWTTGICTQYNYTRSRAGAEAESGHKFGGLIIRVTENTAHVTNIYQGDDGSLLHWEDCQHDGTPLDVVLGDLHCEMEDPQVTADTQLWLAELEINNMAVHDILHFATASHHNRKSAKHNYKMLSMGHSVASDLSKVATVINSYADLCENLFAVESNHNSAIDNWLDDTSAYVNDASNNKTWLMLNYGLRDCIDNGIELTGGLELALSDSWDYAQQLGIGLASNITFGHKHKPETWAQIEVSQHGHIGQNGSRGSTALFGKSGQAMVTGHTHSPAIRGKAFTVGVTASLDQFYNRGGLSGWNHANAIIMPNSTVQLITLYPLNF